MHRHMILHPGSLLVAATLLALPPAPAAAAAVIWVPAGTRVALRFVTPVDSGKITTGTKVHFKIAADVTGGRYVIIRAGMPATGTVTEVTPPGMFGADSRVVIGFITAKAVDGKPIELKDVVIAKATVSNSRVGAGGASVAGALVLGPIGLLAGALVKGSYISVPAGTTVVDTTTTGENVLAP